MKLSNTIADGRIPTNVKLNYLCGNHVCNKHIERSIQELFIESVADSDLLNEAQADAISALVEAKLSKIQAALAPETPEDLDYLLRFIAPKSGGVASVNKLVQSAKQSKDLMADSAWWDNLFNAFGVTDDATKQRVLKQFGNLKPPVQAQPQANDEVVDAEVLPDEGGATSAAGQTAGEAPVIDTSRRAAKPQAKSNKIKQAISKFLGINKPAAQAATKSTNPKEVKNEIDRLSRLEQTVAQRAQFNTELDKLQAKIQNDIQTRQAVLNDRLKQLQKKHAATESLITNFASILLEFPEVRNNLPTIIQMMLGTSRRPTITEDGIQQRARRAIGEGWRDQLNATKQLVSDPQKAQSQYRTQQSTHDSERIAKQAVKALTDIARKRFSETLQSQSITPEQIAKDLATFEKYQKYLKSKKIKPESLNQTHLANYTDLRKRLLMAYRLFNPKGNPFTAPRLPRTPTSTQAAKSNKTDSGWVAILGALQNMVPPKTIQEINTAIQKNPKLSLLRVMQELVNKKHLTRKQAQQLLGRYTNALQTKPSASSNTRNSSTPSPESPRDALRRKYEKFKADADAGKYSTEEENRIYQELNDEYRAIGITNRKH